MLGELTVMLLAAAPAPGAVGSVDGPFGWVDVRGSYESELVFTPEYTPSSAALLYASPSGSTMAAQAQLFGGWGLPFGHHRLALTGAVWGTLIPEPFDVYGYPRHTFFQVSPLRLAASMPLLWDEVAVVPALALSLPTMGFAPAPLFTLSPGLEVRRRVAEVLLLGAEARFELPIFPLVDAQSQLRCDQDGARCSMKGFLQRWRGQLLLRAQWFFAPGLSLGARVDLALRDEYHPLMPTLSPSAPTVRLKYQIFEVRPGVDLTWAITGNFGLTASVGLNARRRTSTPEHMTENSTAWEAGLSAWFRTDERLERAWLER